MDVLFYVKTNKECSGVANISEQQPIIIRFRGGVIIADPYHTTSRYGGLSHEGKLMIRSSQLWDRITKSFIPFDSRIILCD